VVVFTCIQNLDNKPIARPPSNPAPSTITTKLRTGLGEAAEQAKTSVPSALSSDQFAILRDSIVDKFTPYQKELEKELKKISMQHKMVSNQNADIYDEIQQIKANDREFVLI